MTAFQAVRRRFESGLPLHFLNYQDVEDFFALFFPQAHAKIEWARYMVQLRNQGNPAIDVDVDAYDGNATSTASTCSVTLAASETSTASATPIAAASATPTVSASDTATPAATTTATPGVSDTPTVGTDATPTALR